MLLSSTKVFAFAILVPFISTSTIDVTSDEFKTKLDGGGANSFNFSTSFFEVDSWSECNDCDICAASSQRNLFDGKSESELCIACTGITCTKVRIDTTFENAWALNYYTLQSSNSAVDSDPSSISLFGTNDDSIIGDMLNWVNNPLPADRGKDKTFVVGNSVAYKTYRLYMTKKSASSNLRISNYKIANSYLADYVSAINLKLHGFQKFNPSVITLSYNALIGVVDGARPNYVLYFNIKPFGIKTGYSSIMRFTSFKDKKTETWPPDYGDRCPMFHFQPNVNNVIGFRECAQDGSMPGLAMPIDPSIDSFVKIVAVGDSVMVNVNNVEIGSLDVLESKRTTFDKLYVYAGDPVFGPAKVTLRNVVYSVLPSAYFNGQALRATSNQKCLIYDTHGDLYGGDCSVKEAKIFGYDAGTGELKAQFGKFANQCLWADGLWPKFRTCSGAGDQKMDLSDGRIKNTGANRCLFAPLDDRFIFETCEDGGNEQFELVPMAL